MGMWLVSLEWGGPTSVKRGGQVEGQEGGLLRGNLSDAIAM